MTMSCKDPWKMCKSMLNYQFSNSTVIQYMSKSLKKGCCQCANSTSHSKINSASDDDGKESNNVDDKSLTSHFNDVHKLWSGSYGWLKSWGFHEGSRGWMYDYHYQDYCKHHQQWCIIESSHQECPQVLLWSVEPAGRYGGLDTWGTHVGSRGAHSSEWTS